MSTMVTVVTSVSAVLVVTAVSVLLVFYCSPTTAPAMNVSHIPRISLSTSRPKWLLDRNRKEKKTALKFDFNV